MGTRARTLPDGLEGTCGGRALQQGTRLVEAGSRVPRVELRGVSVPQVAEEVGSDVSLREELLVAAHAVPACREERLVDFRVVEAGHRAAVEPQRACREDEVPALERRVPERGALDKLRVLGEQLAHGWSLRKQLWQLLVEEQVVTDDDGHGRLHRFLDVPGSERGAQPLLRLAGPQEDEAPRACIGARRAPLRQLVDLAKGVVRDGLVEPGGMGPCVAEDLIQTGIGDDWHAVAPWPKRH